MTASITELKTLFSDLDLNSSRRELSAHQPSRYCGLLIVVLAKTTKPRGKAFVGCYNIQGNFLLTIFSRECPESCPGKYIRICPKELSGEGPFAADDSLRSCQPSVHTIPYSVPKYFLSPRP